MIYFQSDAKEIILKELQKLGYRFTIVKGMNRDRYHIAFGESGFDNIGIIFKKEHFKTFARLNKKNEGLGDSINLKDLAHMKEMYNVKEIYTIFPDNKIYKVKISDILEHGHQRIVKEGKWVYSFSIHLYKPLNNTQQILSSEPIISIDDI